MMIKTQSDVLQIGFLSVVSLPNTNNTLIIFAFLRVLCILTSYFRILIDSWNKHQNIICREPVFNSTFIVFIQPAINLIKISRHELVIILQSV